MTSLTQRGDGHYIQYRIAGKLKRISTGTTSLQIAKENLRQLESARLRGADNPLPTRTPSAGPTRKSARSSGPTSTPRA